MKGKLGQLIVVVVFLLVIIGFHSTTNTVQAKGGGKLWSANGNNIKNENTGNVGIGTTSPTEKLTVNGKVESTSGGFKFPDGTTQTTAAINENDGDWTVIGTEMYSGVSGNVGIGTGSPRSRLEITGNWPVGIPENTKFGQLTISGYKPSITMDADTNSGNARWMIHNGGDLGFYVNPTDSGWTHPVRLTTSGNVGIGTGSPNYKLDVRGTIGNNTTLYHSDIRWKKNVSTVTYALDKVTDLRGVNFEWKAEEFPEMTFSEGPKFGFIAQEVEEILPELVNTGKDGYKSVQYANIVPLLVEAIKELKKEVEALKEVKADNIALTQEIKDIKDEIGL